MQLPFSDRMKSFLPASLVEGRRTRFRWSLSDEFNRALVRGGPSGAWAASIACRAECAVREANPPSRAPAVLPPCLHPSLSCGESLPKGSLMPQWRKRVGVEPTIRPAKGRIAGFEDRGGHRTPFASGWDYRGVCRAISIPVLGRSDSRLNQLEDLRAGAQDRKSVV